MERIIIAKENITPQLMEIPGVVGVGVSIIKNTINVYVEKITDELLLQIPIEIEGYKTEVIETGRFEAFQARTDKWRPAPGGVSIGHYAITAGTLGISVIDNVSRRRVILSNNHVLANKDSIQNSRANKGDEIWQPGRVDGGSSADTIAKLERWIKMDEVGTNKVDCAIGMPNADADLRDDILEIGVVNKMTEATEGMNVQKSGRTTELTTGTALDVNVTADVSYGPFVATFTDCIRTSNDMGAPGDSGSAICSMDNKIVGLLFAGNRATRSILACKIGNIADLLNIDFGPAPPPGVGAVWPYLLGGGAALMAVTMIPKPKKKPKKKPMIPEKKMPTKGLLIGGGLIAGGIALYLLLKKKEEPPEPPPPGKAYINVYSTPTGADVYLNESYIGKTPISNYEVDPGNYVLVLVKEGYEPHTEMFTISEGETRTFNITLTPIAPPEVAMDLTYLTVDVK